ncbi:hypothetical protein C8Q80DRAFT_1217173 [Daedaleopsis nitida]|nr:hypothetical protein C8Q80DRAFT_1217173 [Daedaleopsis nitida]
MSLLLSLPLELLIAVLTNLDWRDLLRCRQVCMFFKDYVDHDVTAQYKIELAVAGMEDGPPSILTPSDRLSILRERQKAWRSLKWKSRQEYPMLGGNVWELYGGMLAQADREGLLTVTQLPSKQWKIPDMGIAVRDFSMDPAQDLLIIVENVRADHVLHCRVHLRSLQTGAVHPAAKGGILEHTPLRIGHDSYTIQTSENLLGLLVEGDEERELLIWDWQTGALRMHIKGPEIPAFAFLSSRYILLPNYPDVDLTEDDTLEYDAKCQIIIIDLEAILPQPTLLHDVPYLCSLRYPEFAPDSMATSINIRSDPAPCWRPSRALKVPFCAARSDRLFVVTLELIQRDAHRVLLSFIPASTFLAAIAALAADSPGPDAARETQTRPAVPWATWGPAGSRFLLGSPMQSAVWVCYVYGMRFARVRRAGSNQAVSVLDFNQLAVRRALARGADEGGDDGGDGDGDGELKTALRLLPTVWRAGMFFKDAVETRLPYMHQQRTTFGREGTEGEGQYTAAMLNEDSLILVSSQSHIRKYRVLTF